MIDLDEIRTVCQSLAARLANNPHWPELRVIYLDLVTVVGQLQGAVAERSREQRAMEAAQQAQGSLDRLKAEVRQVGLDIRLASEAGLSIGLQTAIQSALETLDRLRR